MQGRDPERYPNVGCRVDFLLRSEPSWPTRNAGQPRRADERQRNAVPGAAPPDFAALVGTRRRAEIMRSENGRDSCHVMRLTDTVLLMLCVCTLCMSYLGSRMCDRDI